MDVNRMSKSQLKSYVEKTAKAANKRLYNLEKADLQKASAAYRKVEVFAHDRRFFMTKTGKVRFRESVEKLTIQQLKSEAAKLDFFMNRAKTSSVKGLKDKYKRGYETFMENKGAGTNMSFEEYASFWADDIIRKIIDIFGSGIILEISDLLTSKYDETITAMHDNQHVMSAEVFVALVRNQVEGITKVEDENEEGVVGVVKSFEIK